MRDQTPVQRAVSTYCGDWMTTTTESAGTARVNPETLANATSPDWTFRYIDISAVTKGRIDWPAVQLLRFDEAPSRARRVIRPRDTLICTVRPLLRAHAYAAWADDQPTVCSTGFAVVRCSEDLNPHFFKHLPFSEQVTRQLVAWQCGTNYPAVNEQDIRKLLVPLPPLEEQASIANVLNAVDSTIERTATAVECARQLQYSLLHDLLKHGTVGSDRKSNKRPAHWLMKRVWEVAEVGSGVTLGKDVSGFKHVELPYLRVANVQDGRLDLGTVKTVRVRCDEVERYRLQPGDVLMTEGGDIDKLGRGTLWDGQIRECLHQNHIFRVRANRDLLRPDYFSCVVESDIAKGYFMRVAKRTTNLASTNKTQVRNFIFPVPPLDEQERIALTVRAAKDRMAALSRKLVALEDLKRSLMHDILTGRVRIDPSKLRSALEP